MLGAGLCHAVTVCGGYKHSELTFEGSWETLDWILDELRPRLTCQVRCICRRGQGSSGCDQC